MPPKYRCEYCEGTVREKLVEREALKHKAGFVILEDVVIGVCDKCGNRYYSADTLKRAQAVALAVNGMTPFRRFSVASSSRDA